MALPKKNGRVCRLGRGQVDWVHNGHRSRWAHLLDESTEFCSRIALVPQPQLSQKYRLYSSGPQPQQTVGSSHPSASLPLIGSLSATCSVPQSHKNLPRNAPMIIDMIMYPLKYMANSMMRYARPNCTMCMMDRTNCCSGVGLKARYLGPVVLQSAG